MKTKIFVAAAVLGAMAVLSGCGSSSKTTVNLNDYVSVSFNGYDGYGTAFGGIAVARFIEDYDEIITENLDSLDVSKLDDDQKAAFTNISISSKLGGAFNLIDTIMLDAGVDKKTGLSNGDTVIYEWKVDEDEAESLSAIYGVQLSYSDMEFTVEGLEETGTFDAFKDMEVVFEGVAPNGTASLGGTKPAGAWQEIDYSLDKSEGLSNGDTVTVTAKFDEDLIEEYGMIPESTEKTFTAEGLLSYVTSLDQITDEAIELMKKQGEDVLTAYLAKKDPDNLTLTGIEYLGSYLLTAKNKDERIQDAIYLVFKANIHLDHTYKYGRNEYQNIGDIYDYWYIKFENLMAEPDGSIAVDITDYDTAPTALSFTIEREHMTDKTWKLDGYTSLEALYGNAITSNLEKYIHEDAAEDTESGANVNCWEDTAQGIQYKGGDGKYVTGWNWISDGSNTYCYYFDEDGYLLTDTETPDGCTVDEEGRWTEDGVVQTQ